ncbi:protein tramtrack, beta isoform isoform X2 [Microplitis mediator]|nr:protein tramtrack, beta isoform isoform X2 [Microplitis mediator]XP_057332536.1 protein tramtrack, beta isoform isoform X2 [Microplitis mediator]XP_057332537.1 protein tramtrack, beta isoform isoform X2 [Microplitis mediator]XP_057332538.1 protein tramtrack, beta isoform isoform X2 [Microplitis mediator]
MDQQYCLRWNNHPANLTDVLSSLLAREALCDVTLACVGETFKAHQTILSACSPYFENIFLQNIHPHPIIFLKDVNDTEMKALLHFMYKGEVNVSQHLLPMFLKTAEALQIRGLTDNSVNNKNNDDKSSSPEPDQTQTSARHADSPNLQPHPEKRKRKVSGTNYDVSMTGGPPSERFLSDSQASSQCSYKSSPTVIPKSNNTLGGDLEDGGRAISPSSQAQTTIKQELDHHMPDFHDNISLPKNVEWLHQRDDMKIDDNDNDDDETRMENINMEDQFPASVSYQMSRENRKPIGAGYRYDLTSLSLAGQITPDYCYRENREIRCRPTATLVSTSPYSYSSPIANQPGGSSLTLNSDPVDSSNNYFKSINNNDSKSALTFCVNSSVRPRKNINTRAGISVIQSTLCSNTSAQATSAHHNHAQRPASGGNAARKLGKFKPTWLDIYPWLQYDSINNLMYCKYCRKWSDTMPEIRTSFAAGNGNFRLEIVNHHDRCKAHNLCVARDNDDKGD